MFNITYKLMVANLFLLSALWNFFTQWKCTVKQFTLKNNIFIKESYMSDGITAKPFSVFITFIRFLL
jgi:hypothetical protein